MRKWIDLLLFYSGVIILISGVVLYIMPHGRVAYFTNWSFLGLNKDNWDDLHVVFGILMVVVSIWHTVLNWKVLKKYLFKRESVFALIIILFTSALTIKNVYPIKAIIDFEEYIKNSWEVNKIAVPIPHAELLSLKDFCKKLNIPLDKAINKLQNKGFKFTPTQTLKTIAKNNNTSPAKIYEIIKPANNTTQNFSGIGRMSLDDFCKKYKCNTQKAIKLLKQKGIKATSSQTLKEIANQNNLLPIDIANMIVNK